MRENSSFRINAQGDTAVSKARRYGQGQILRLLEPQNKSTGDDGKDLWELRAQARDEIVKVITVLGFEQNSTPYVTMSRLDRPISDVLHDAGLGSTGTIVIPR